MLRRVLGEDKAFRIELAAELGRVQTDPRQMEQVWLNLTLNAPDGRLVGGGFTISPLDVTLPSRDRRLAPGDEVPVGNYVRMDVTDTGHGMDAATRARVFEPFFTTKPVGQGSG